MCFFFSLEQLSDSDFSSVDSPTELLHWEDDEALLKTGQLPPAGSDEDESLTGSGTTSPVHRYESHSLNRTGSLSPLLQRRQAQSGSTSPR